MFLILHEELLSQERETWSCSREQGPRPLTVHTEENPKVQYYAEFLLLAEMGARTLQQQEYNLNTNRFTSWMFRSRKAFLVTLDTLFSLYLFPRWERYEGTNEKEGQELFLRQFVLELRLLINSEELIKLGKCNTDGVQN